jgi:hypothetical protein
MMEQLRQIISKISITSIRQVVLLSRQHQQLITTAQAQQKHCTNT